MVFRIYAATMVMSQPDGTKVKYDSFLAKYYEGARLQQKRKQSWEAVEALVEEGVAAHRKSNPERLELSGQDHGRLFYHQPWGGGGGGVTPFF